MNIRVAAIDRLRVWLDRHQDEPFTLTQAQQDEVSRTINMALTGCICGAPHFESTAAPLTRGHQHGPVRYGWDDLPSRPVFVRGPRHDVEIIDEEHAIVETFCGGTIDPRPDYCWRCDALPAPTDPAKLGLCDHCRVDLTGKAG